MGLREEKPMHDWQSLSHVRWDCKYHVVIIPKYRKRNLYGKFKRHVGEIIKDLCRQRGIELLEGNLKADHVHMCLSIPPKFSVAFVIGFLKGKSAVRIHRYLVKNAQTKRKHFWSRGYCVSTVGLDEETIRKYIREQEEAEKQLELDFE
jgi:putative transposase